MKATLITRFKQVTAAGDIIELVVWRLPSPLPASPHGYKYRAAFIIDGRRVIGFDNERGKGDHQHDASGQEWSYPFTPVEQLVEDFIAEVAAERIRRGR